MRPGQQFLVLCLLSAATAVAAAGALTYAVDPYAVWGTRRIEGFNAVKPEAYTHADLAKVALARRLAPRGVILGNSRMDVGLDPMSPSWPADARPVYNLAIPGHGLGGDLANLRRVYAGGGAPRVAVVGVDFLDFLVDPTRREAPDLKPPDEGLSVRLHDFVTTTLSITALTDTIATLWAQRDPYAPNMTERGLDTMRQYDEFVQTEGHYNIFHQRNFEYIRARLGRGTAVVGSDGRRSSSFDELRAIIEWCRSRNVAVDLVIYPYHADLLEIFRVTGLWPAFETWKRMLVEMVGRETAAGRNVRIGLWDFSGYSRFATEEIPAKGDRKTRMRWYWEAGHFKSALGELILRRLFDEAGPADFGVRLDPATVESQIGAVRSQAERYRAAHPAEVARIDTIYRELSRLQRQR